MNSSRLPGKVLLKFDDQTIIEYIHQRIKKYSKLVDDVVIATTTNESDDAIINLCLVKDIKYYRGSENNVIQRVIDTAYFFNADIIVDITGDCPFIDPLMIDQLIEELKDNDYDYISNDVIERSYPDGFDCQVYHTECLKIAKGLIKDKNHFNHCGWNIPTYCSEIYDIGNIKAPIEYDLPGLGLTLDEKEDYLFLIKIYNIFKYQLKKDEPFSMYEIIDYIKKNSEIINNKDVVRKIPGAG